MLVPVYIPDSLANSETDHVIIGISVLENQDLTNSSFRSDLANKLVALYVEAKGRKTSRRKRRSGSTSATVSYHLLLLHLGELGRCCVLQKLSDISRTDWSRAMVDLSNKKGFPCLDSLLEKRRSWKNSTQLCNSC